jgi:hypothetical protein
MIAISGRVLPMLAEELVDLAIVAEIRAELARVLISAPLEHHLGQRMLQFFELRIDYTYTSRNGNTLGITRDDIGEVGTSGTNDGDGGRRLISLETVSSEGLEGACEGEGAKRQNGNNAADEHHDCGCLMFVLCLLLYEEGRTGFG